MPNITCTFFGHRKIEDAENLKDKVYEVAENLILNHKVKTFLFGSKSEFNSLCENALSELKEKYPDIKRIYIRAEYPYISGNYEKYLLKSFEETYFPNNAINSGKAVYVERNKEMIDKSDFCIFYYKEDYKPQERKHSKSDLSSYQPKSGTKLAYDYALKKNKKIINIAID